MSTASSGLDVHSFTTYNNKQRVTLCRQASAGYCSRRAPGRPFDDDVHRSMMTTRSPAYKRPHEFPADRTRVIEVGAHRRNPLESVVAAEPAPTHQHDVKSTLPAAFGSSSIFICKSIRHPGGAVVLLTNVTETRHGRTEVAPKMVVLNTGINRYYNRYTGQKRSQAVCM